ncbi:MAG: ABC transporter ATP-binding protein [Bacilli bacterium]
MTKNNVQRDEKSTMRSKTVIIKKLMQYGRGYEKQTSVVIALLLWIMLVNVCTPYLMKVAIDDFVPKENTQGLIMIGVLLVLLHGSAMFAATVRMKKTSYITNNMLISIRHELYSHIQKLSFSFFDHRPVGKVLARVMGDVNALQNLFNQAIVTLIPELLSLVGVAMIMFALDPKLALASLAILPVLAGALFYIEANSRKRWDEYRSKRSNLNAFTHENFSGQRTVQSFAQEKNTERTFLAMTKEMMDAFLHAVRLNDLFWPFVELSWGVGISVVFGVGAYLVNDGSMQIGTLIAFSLYIGMFWRPIMNLTNFYNVLITNFSAADRIFDILEVQPDMAQGEMLPAMSNITGEVTFEDVTFCYDEKKKVLDGVSFHIPAGSKVALVGPTGAGKTTIISLLSRFYDPTHGVVKVDGIDVKNVMLESYREQLGIMLQDSFLFSGTVMENIRYGKLGASDEEVIEAAKAVCAHEFIMGLPQGYASDVNERGTVLSLGQRQLLSFARALLANPRILILDEATSNIDTHTERLVQQGIQKLLSGRTSFVIAHRLSTITDCDIIMVVNNGKITDSGTHETLIQKQGLYRDLCEAQYRFLHEGA